MMTDNENVAAGLANGTRAHCEHIVLKPGEQPFDLELSAGMTIPAVFASHVDCVYLWHENAEILPQEFCLQPHDFSFNASIPTSTDSYDPKRTRVMKGCQIPLVSNTATTGHKLQGATVENLLVNDWLYQNNWVYVVLSRVKTMKGLKIREKLSEDTNKYKPAAKLDKMLKEFEELKVKHINDSEYNLMMPSNSFV